MTKRRHIAADLAGAALALAHPALALAGCSDRATAVADRESPAPPCCASTHQRHYTPGEGATSNFVDDDHPEALHCVDHACRGDISGLATHSKSGPSGDMLWAITDQGSKDRDVDGKSYGNSKWLFQVRLAGDGPSATVQVTHLHLLREDEPGAWNLHDPEALVRAGDQLAIVDGGNSWRDQPAGNVYEPGYCLGLARDAASHRCTIQSWSASAAAYTSQTTKAACTGAGGVWLAEPPSVQGRISRSSNKLRPYAYARFDEPALDTNGSRVGWDQHPIDAFVRFRFPSTCSAGGDLRPCGQWADLGLPGTAGHFNIEAAAVTAGDHLVLITKGPKRPEVSAGTDCAGGFYTVYRGVPRRVDDGDTHVFSIPHFRTRKSSGSEDVAGCACPSGATPTEDWRHCTGCAIDASNAPILATFVTRFNLYEAPYSTPFTSGSRQRVTDAAVLGNDLYYTTRSAMWRIPIGAGPPAAAAFTGAPVALPVPESLGATATACTDEVRWCQPELESIAVISPTRFVFSGEEDNSYTRGIHNWIVRHDH